MEGWGGEGRKAYGLGRVSCEHAIELLWLLLLLRPVHKLPRLSGATTAATSCCSQHVENCRTTARGKRRKVTSAQKKKKNQKKISVQCRDRTDDLGVISTTL